MKEGRYPEEEDLLERRRAERHKIVEKAVEVVDRIILDGTDGSVEETNYLTAMVAKKLMEKALNPLFQEMLRRDLGLKGERER